MDAVRVALFLGVALLSAGVGAICGVATTLAVLRRAPPAATATAVVVRLPAVVTVVPPGSEVILEHARAADRVLVAISAASHGQPLPDDLPPAVRERITLMMTGTIPRPVRLTDFQVEPVTWRYDQRVNRASSERGLVLYGELYGSKELTYGAAFGRPAGERERIALTGDVILVRVAWQGERWVAIEVVGGTRLVPGSPGPS